MDQRNKWETMVSDLDDITFKGTTSKLYNTYQVLLKDIKKTAKQYIDEYETLSFSKRMEAERLLLLGDEIKRTMINANKAVVDTITEGCIQHATNGYYGTYFAMEGLENLKIPMAFLDQGYILSAVSNPVNGKVFSQRLYSNTLQLAEATQAALTFGAIDGKGYKYVAKRIEDLTEADYKRALRIARTEGGRVSSEATQRAYSDAKTIGVELQKRWLSTLDEVTRNSHRLLDGQIVETEDNFTSPETGAKGKGPRLMGQAGEDINCRCTTIAVVKDYKPEYRLDNETGEKVKNMSYTEWQQYKGIPVSVPKAVTTFVPPTIKTKEFKTVRETVDYGVDLSKEWRKTLTKDEIEAMERYTNYSYEINGYAREGDNYFLASSSKFSTSPERQVEIKKHFKAMESAINKSTFKDDMVLYRGTNANALNIPSGQITEETLNSLIGKTISDKAYLSTTGLKDVAETYGSDVILKINVPKGSKGVFVDTIKDTAGYIDEDFNLEFLLQRDQPMRITGYRKAVGKYGKSYFEVDVELITSGSTKASINVATTAAADNVVNGVRRRGHLIVAEGEVKEKIIASDLNIDIEKATKYKEAIRGYTGSDYEYIREYQQNQLRNYPGFKLKDYYKEQGELIEEYITNSPKWEGSPLYRGIKVDDKTFNNLKIGTVLDQGGVSSWSDNINIANSFAINFENDRKAIVFRIQSTNKATSIRHISTITGENEVLMSKTAKQVITGIQKSFGELDGEKYEKWIISVKELEE